MRDTKAKLLVAMILALLALPAKATDTILWEGPKPFGLEGVPGDKLRLVRDDNGHIELYEMRDMESWYPAWLIHWSNCMLSCLWSYAVHEFLEEKSKTVTIR